jgi:hypothetical protein
MLTRVYMIIHTGTADKVIGKRTAQYVHIILHKNVIPRVLVTQWCVGLLYCWMFDLIY